MTDHSHTLPGSGGAYPDRGDVARIGIQSANRLRRESLAACLDTVPRLTVVGHVARYEDVVPLYAAKHPAIVVLDAGRDVHETVAGCELIRQRCRDLCVAVICEQFTTQELSTLRAAGVDALVPYAHGLAAVVTVLHRLAAGASTVYASGSGLSPRQREVLLLLASGYRAAEVADLLGISPDTVEFNKRQVYAMLGATSALQAVARVASWGIVDEDLANGDASPAGVDPLATPPAGWLPHAEPDRPLLTIATGSHRDTLDRVVVTLTRHRLPVVRDDAPSWMEPMHCLRWHRGRFARVLVDPSPDHWRVAAASWRRTVVVRSRHYPTVAMGRFAAGDTTLLEADHIEDYLVSVLLLVDHGYTVMDRSAAEPLEHSARARFPGPGPQRPALTARENDILTSIGRNFTIRQTARQLGIAVKTVENTQVHLFRKLGVHSRSEALAAARALGLLQPGADPT